MARNVCLIISVADIPISPLFEENAIFCPGEFTGNALSPRIFGPFEWGVTKLSRLFSSFK